jgi:hypothetical protein
VFHSTTSIPNIPIIFYRMIDNIARISIAVNKKVPAVLTGSSSPTLEKSAGCPGGKSEGIAPVGSQTIAVKVVGVCLDHPTMPLSTIRMRLRSSCSIMLNSVETIALCLRRFEGTRLPLNPCSTHAPILSR